MAATWRPRPTGNAPTSGTATFADAADGFTAPNFVVSGPASNGAATIDAAGNWTYTPSADFHGSDSFTVRVTDDDGNLETQLIAITVTQVNNAPTQLSLSATSIAENNLPNATVGTFTTTDPDVNDTFGYALVPGTGDTDNAAFTIVGSQLQANSSFNFESKSSYSVRVRSADQGGLSTEKELTISVVDVDENLYLFGLAGNDSITASYTGNGTQHAWSVNLNNMSIFNGSVLNGGGLVIDGLGGVDTLQIVGLADADTFELGSNEVLANRASARFLNMAAVRILGGTGNDSLKYGPGAASVSGTVSFDGGTGIDTIEASDIDNVWSITGVGAGDLGTATRTFTTIESVRGGSGNDQFVFGAAGRLIGQVLGGSGSDTISFAAKASAHTVNLYTNTASSTGGIGGIETFIGSASAAVTDILIGANSDTSWMINGADTGSFNSTTTGIVTFLGFESLTGGTATDIFTFTETGSLTKTLTGGTATGVIDRLDLSTKSGALDFQLNTTRSVPGTIGAYTGIEQITANGDVGTKVTRVNDTTTAWAVNAVGQIIVNGVTYSGVGSIAGGPGMDTLTGPAANSTWSIDAANGGSLAIPGAIVAFTGIENLTGSTVSDTFVFGSSGSLLGTLNGGSGADSVNLSAKSGALDFQLNTTRSVPGTIGAYTGIEQITANGDVGTKVTRVNDTTTAWAVNAVGQIVVNGVTYSGVGSIAGGPGMDTITGPAVDSIWSIDAANGGSLAIPGVSVAFTGIENLTGSTASDAFDVLPGGSVAGNLNGGTGTGINSLSYSQWALGVTVNLSVTTPSNASGISGLTSNIQMVTGGSGDDTLTGNVSKSTILIGLVGNDSLVGGSQRDLLFGGSGSDVLQAGSGDDLLIAGTTAFDTDRTAILQSFAEWTSAFTFAQRTANIWGIESGPRANGSAFLNSDPLDSVTDSVFEDSDMDELTGGTGQDWFFASEADLTDFAGTGSKPDRRN